MFYLPEKLPQTIVSGLGLQMIEEFRAGEVREGTCTAQCTGIPQTPKLVLAHPKNDHACSRFSDHGCLLERWGFHLRDATSGHPANSGEIFCERLLQSTRYVYTWAGCRHAYRFLLQESIPHSGTDTKLSRLAWISCRGRATV